MIADVSGHNVGAALMMAAARSALRSSTRITLTGRNSKNTNFVLYDDLTHAELFMTMFYTLNTKLIPKFSVILTAGIIIRFCCVIAHVHLDTDGMLIGMLASVEFEEKNVVVTTNDLFGTYRRR